MRVLLAGATGAIGFTVTHQLIGAGHQVIGLTRNREGAKRLYEAGASPVITDVLDAKALLPAVRGRRADAVIHQATSLARTPKAYRQLRTSNALHTRGTANLLRAAEMVGAGRFITQSYLYGYGYHDHGEDLLTEETPFAPVKRGRLGRHLSALRANEQQTLTTAGIDGIALRYGVCYGPEPTTLRLISLGNENRLSTTHDTGVMSPIHLVDAASATVAALEHGRAGQAYNIVDDQPVNWCAFIDLIGDITGVGAVRVPNWSMMLTPYRAAVYQRAHVALDNGKAKRELGWRPRYPTLLEGLESVAALTGHDWKYQTMWGGVGPG